MVVSSSDICHLFFETVKVFYVFLLSTNMNQAAQWSLTAVQKTWPMKSFWTGLMAPSKKSYIWDDNSGFNFTYFTPNKGKFIPPACYYANSNETFFWTETICTLLPPAVVPTLICQDTICKLLKFITCDKFF